MEEADALCQRLAIIDHGTQDRGRHAAELKVVRFRAGYLLRLRFDRALDGTVRDARRVLPGVSEVRAVRRSR